MHISDMQPYNRFVYKLSSVDYYNTAFVYVR
jgi:hypothetical protein